MLDAAKKIRKYTRRMTFSEFSRSDIVTDAVIRNFEVIGEASARLPESFKKRHLHIDWQQIKGFRNRLVHDYFGVDKAIVWKVIKDYLPKLVKDINALSKSNQV